ncbi:MAG: hypothetical protein V7L14_16340 [Nostoc sp.]|uniref:ABC transporter permease subunit n=1 Tax=Nostoc sp. TaxID=1180 RepID=UPI002FF53CEC
MFSQPICSIPQGFQVQNLQAENKRRFLMIMYVNMAYNISVKIVRFKLYQHKRNRYLKRLIVFASLEKPSIATLQILLVSPLSNFYGLSELTVKAAPILLIAVGLAVCFQAKVWNIGAEGQFTIGAICGGAVALAFPNINNLHLAPSPSD